MSRAPSDGRGGRVLARALAVAWAMFGGEAPVGAAEPDGLPERVSRLRAEVDDLAHRLETERRRARDALASMRVERADLRRQIRLERVRRATLRRLARERSERSQTLEAEAAALIAPLRRAVARVDAYVQNGLPYEVEARRRRLDVLQTELSGLQPDPARVFRRLWRFVEEEEALTREVGFSQQAVSLEGRRQLVEVARIGMALLYVRTADGRVALARQAPDGRWGYAVVTADPARRAVERVLGDVEANRRLGPQRLLVPEAMFEAAFDAAVSEDR